MTRIVTRMSFSHLIILGGILSFANSARILGIFQIAAKSHYSCNHAVVKSLHAAGHQITMIRPFPREVGIENFTTIDSSFDNMTVFIGMPNPKDFSTSLMDIMSMILESELENCRTIIKLPEIQLALNSKEKLYDVMIIELLLAHECFFPLAEQLGIPVIGVVTLHSWKIADRVIGLPNNPAVIPLEMPGCKPEMNFMERFENLWNHITLDYRWQPVKDKALDKFYREYYPENVLYKKYVSLVFYNNHHTLLPRPMPPNAIEIGGIHVVPAKPLPTHMQKFIDEAPRGVILFTFGSVVNGTSLTSEQRNAFLTAFELIPQRVIWKFEGTIENLPENIMLVDWVPQRDILEQKNVIAFMSHCGQSGVYEAVMTGTPVITIPLFGDQPSNAALLLRRRVGVDLDLNTVTKEKVLTALNEIVNDTSYYERMQELSRAFKDRPMSPQEVVVYWTEYVLRHDGAPYLRALGADMPIYKYLMLDIVAVALIIMSFAALIVFIVIRKCSTLFTMKMKLCYKSGISKKVQ